MTGVRSEKTACRFYCSHDCPPWAGDFGSGLLDVVRIVPAVQQLVVLRFVSLILDI